MDVQYVFPPKFAIGCPSPGRSVHVLFAPRESIAQEEISTFDISPSDTPERGCIIDTLRTKVMSSGISSHFFRYVIEIQARWFVGEFHVKRTTPFPVEC